MRFVRAFAVGVVLAGVLAAAAAAGGYTDPSYATPVGTVGVSYSHTISWKPGTGCPPYSYQLDPGNQLPPGLSLNSSSGVISGNPTKAGTFNFYISQIDNCGNEGQGNSYFTITIRPGTPPSVTTSSLKPAIVGSAYSMQLTASVPGVTFALSGGLLPAGLTLTSNGLISGTPTTVATATFSVTATNGSGSSQPKQFALPVAAPLTLTVKAPTVGEVGVPLNASIEAAGGFPAYTWALDTATTLPAGLALDGTNGVVTGTPTSSGRSVVRVTVADSASDAATVELNLTIASRLTITSKRIKRLGVGHAFAVKLAVSGGVPQLRWSIASGKLPAGIRLAAKSGSLFGSARTAGTFHVRVRVKDALGVVATHLFRLSVH